MFWVCWRFCTPKTQSWPYSQIFALAQGTGKVQEGIEYSYFHHTEGPPVFFSTLPSRYHYHPAFAAHSIFLLDHSPTSTSLVLSQDHKSILSILSRCSTSLVEQSSSFPALHSHSQLHQTSLHRRPLTQDRPFTYLMGSSIFVLDSPLFQVLFSTAFSLSHGLIPWNTDIRCLEVFVFEVLASASRTTLWAIKQRATWYLFITFT